MSPDHHQTFLNRALYEKDECFCSLRISIPTLSQCLEQWSCRCCSISDKKKRILTSELPVAEHPAHGGSESHNTVQGTETVEIQCAK